MSGPPQELTSFVGREVELADVVGLITRRRLVTLTGIGGCGKSRLAARVADRVGGTWRDGMRFVDLAATSDPALVPQVVAAAVGVPVEPDGDQLGRLAAQLRARHLLLYLDTCEHVLDPVAGLVERLLTACPDISVLATSREPLGIAGETTWRVPSLRPQEAVLLFAERAALVAPVFDVNRSADQVAAVCTRVDHIPLGIELAAAWVRALTPVQIAAGLDDTFGLLVRGPRNAVPRHQTLQASMSWSYALLDEPEKRLFRRLAVFADTFTLDAARAVGVDDPDGAPAPGRHDVLALVGRLLDTSLVTSREVAGELRYRMLDTVRQYAEARLRETGEAEALQDRHLEFVLSVAVQAETGADEDQDRWRTTLGRYRADVSAALRWGLTPDSPARALRGRQLAAAMSRQWLISGQTREGLPMLDRAIELGGDEETGLQAQLYAGKAMLAMASGQLASVTEAARRGADIAAVAGDDRTRARCLSVATFPVFFEDFERCEALALEAQEAAAASGEVFGASWAGVTHAYSLVTRNRVPEAEAVVSRVYAVSHGRHDRFCAAFARGALIFTRMTSGDVPGAVAVGREVVELVQPLGDYFGVGTLTCNAAQAVAVSGDLTEARRLVDPVIESIEPSRQRDVVGIMVPIGLIHLWQGHLEEALAWFEKGVERLEQRPRDWTAARCLPGLVGALRRLGRVDEAAAWADRGERLLSTLDGPYEHADLLDEHGRLVAPADPGRARELHMHAFVLRRDHGVRLGFPDSLDALGDLAAAAGEASEAVRLIAASDGARQAMGCPRPPVNQGPHEQMVATLRETLGPDAFGPAWDEGAGADVDELVAALTRGRGHRGGGEGRLAILTPAELQVARRVSEGLSNPEIAERLYMSRSTVKAHLARAFTKLGISHRAALASLVQAESGPG